jgi:hypothetical protein
MKNELSDVAFDNWLNSEKDYINFSSLAFEDEFEEDEYDEIDTIIEEELGEELPIPEIEEDWFEDEYGEGPFND